MKPRIHAVLDASAPKATQDQFSAIATSLGMVPNLHRVMAHSPAALNALMAMGENLQNGSIKPQLAEKIAIATAVANSCGYCASAHHLIGAGVGIPAEELQRNLRFSAADPATEVVLQFVAKLVERRGQLSDSEFNRLRDAGFSDAAIIEVIAHVAMTTFTNLINNALQTELDFPEVEFSGQAV